jgi:hypothetical protein
MNIVWQNRALSVLTPWFLHLHLALLFPKKGFLRVTSVPPRLRGDIWVLAGGSQ